MHNKKNKQKDVIECYKKGYSQEQVAEKFGICEKTVRNWLREKDIAGNRLHPEKVIKKAVKLYESGLSSLEVAKLLDLKYPETVVYWARKHNIFHPRGTPKGKYGLIHNQKLKLTAFLLYKKGLSYSQIKDELKLSSLSVVSKWIRIEGISRKPGHPPGNLTPKNILIRQSLKYKEWRMSVFERDKWTCQCCDEVGGGLHAHHILSFSKYPSMRFEIKNGVTLCEDCHRGLHFPKANSKTA